MELVYLAELVSAKFSLTKSDNGNIQKLYTRALKGGKIVIATK